MHRLTLIVVVVAVVGCSKKTDKCKTMIEKSMKVLGEIAALRGVKLGDKERDQLVGQCKKAVKDGHPPKELDCVMNAADDKAVRNCHMKGYEDHLARSKEVEAAVHLTKLGKNAKVAFIATAEFPKGKVGPTPATPCCGEQIKQCVPTDVMWNDPVWQALEFTVDGAFNYQYTYESDGKTFTATAVGDLGCTGTPKTTTITGRVGSDGEPEVSKP